jgi:site-specific DNA recombinase
LELDARIARLKERLKNGDPDMAADELHAAIDRAEQKRHQLIDRQPISKESAKLLSMLPQAGALYRKQIADGLNGDPRAAVKAHVLLRDMLGEVRLKPGKNASLWAEYSTSTAVLLQGAGTGGRGDRI